MNISTKSAPLVNCYIHRTATIDKPCFICNKYTTAVLREENGGDWFYVCLSHLNDRGFATLIPEPVPPVQIPKKAIKTSDKKEEKDKKDKEDKEDKDNKDSNNKDTDEKKKDDDKEKSKDTINKEKDDDNAKSKPKPKPPQQQPLPPPKPKKYILHRDIFYLREKKVLKNQKEKEAQRTLNLLPNVPKSKLG